MRWVESTSASKRNALVGTALVYALGEATLAPPRQLGEGLHGWIEEGSRRGRLGLVLGLALSALACAAVAYADNTISDGDGVTPITNQNMGFGAVSCATPTSKSALVAVTRNGAAGSRTSSRTARPSPCRLSPSRVPA